MSNEQPDTAVQDTREPLGQRLYDNWPLLMFAGIAIMALIYTGWGLWEIVTLPQAQLP